MEPAELADAAKLVSRLLFINLDAQDDAWPFLSPRASHRLARYDIEQIFDFTVPVTLGIDDFEFDDY